MFQKHKDQALLELKQEINDKSKKGSVDTEILDILTYINEHFKQLYTTSSCAGRIILDSITKDRKKNQCIWLYVNHKGQAKLQDIQDQINQVMKQQLECSEQKKENKKESKSKKQQQQQQQQQQIEESSSGNIEREVWLLVEPPILHICCKDVKSASILINHSHTHGFKSSGIFSIKPDKVMVEIKGSEKLEVPLIKNGKLLVDDKYLQSLVEVSNEKMQKRDEVLKKFQEGLERLKASKQLDQIAEQTAEEEISNTSGSNKKKQKKIGSKKFNKGSEERNLMKNENSEKFSLFQMLLVIGFLFIIFLVAIQYIQLWRD